MDGVCSTHGEQRSTYKILVLILKGTNHSEDKCVDGKIILKWILMKQGGRMWIGLMWLTLDTSSGLL
jgi:hypothetical protein